MPSSIIPAASKNPSTWRLSALLLSALAISVVFLPARHSWADAAAPIKVVAFGDSLTAGYLLPGDQSFPAVLQKALRKDGFNISIVNAGVSGDTAPGGLARLDWSISAGTQAVILELGANDMLRGVDPTVIRATLDKILAHLTARHIKVLIVGMQATPSLGKAYCEAFNKIYRDLAAKYHAPLYPFFLAGVATHKELTLADGMHPNAAGVATMVRGILPQVEALLRSIPAKTEASGISPQKP